MLFKYYNLTQPRRERSASQGAKGLCRQAPATKESNISYILNSGKIIKNIQQ